MAFTHGKNTVIWWNNADLTSYMDSAELSVEVEVGDTTTFGNNWKSAIPGLINATFNGSGKYDSSQWPLYLASDMPTDTGYLTYVPAGPTLGYPARLMKLQHSSYAESSPVGDVVSWSWEIASQAVTPLGFVLHGFSEDTNTTTGTSVDGSAATTTGWTAHLHVSNVDGGSWVVQLEDSADNNTFASVTSGAFTAATAATSQRLTSASGATLRRYVRYTATRTGGSAGDGITFALAVARQMQ